jgi:nucleoside-diphosphate-sugar epimerase
VSSLRYLVTGGAGFLGVNLVRFLLSRGVAVRSLDVAPFNFSERSKVEVIEGDIRDRAIVDRAVAGTDVVVHCAAALPLYTPAEILSTTVAGTRNLLESAFAHGVNRVVFVSSTAVYGIPDHHPILESDQLYGVGPYGQAKILAEELCTQFRTKGMCVPIIRPKTFVGPERLGVFELLYAWAYEGRNFPLLGSQRNRYQLLDVDDLCEAIYLCSTCDRQLVNDTFNVGAKEFTTLRQDFQAVLDRAGHGRRIILLPAWPSVCLLMLLDRLRLSPIYRWVYETLLVESFVSIERITRRLGFQPKYSNREALVRNYDWYVANRATFQGKSGISHRMPWNHGVLRFARHFF